MLYVRPARFRDARHIEAVASLDECDFVFGESTGRPIAVEALPELSAAVCLLGGANARGRSYVEKAVGHGVSLSLRRNLSATRAATQEAYSSRLGGAHDRKVDFCLRDDVEEVREHVLGDNRDYLHYLGIGEPTVFDRLQIGVADLAARLG